MTAHTALPTYTSYLLRLRQQPAPQGEERQVMLRRVGSEKQHYFADLETLLQFLETVTSNQWSEGALMQRWTQGR